MEEAGNIMAFSKYDGLTNPMRGFLFLPEDVVV